MLLVSRGVLKDIDFFHGEGEVGLQGLEEGCRVVAEVAGGLHVED
ncbi:MAG: hypothetical protein JW384_03408 [Nitrosomonadaceae bacterium]|nr:hypothetical protein [Nitrosomonadaceae bacterium]